MKHDDMNHEEKLSKNVENEDVKKTTTDSGGQGDNGSVVMPKINNVVDENVEDRRWSDIVNVQECPCCDGHSDHDSDGLDAQDDENKILFPGGDTTMFKIKFDDVYVRFSSKEDISISEFMDAISECLRVRKEVLLVFYQDDELDWVRLASSSDFEEMGNMLRGSRNIVRLLCKFLF